MVQCVHPHVIHVPWTHLTQHSKLQCNRFFIFTQLTAESRYISQCSEQSLYIKCGKMSVRT